MRKSGMIRPLRPFGVDSTNRNRLPIHRSLSDFNVNDDDNLKNNSSSSQSRASKLPRLSSLPPSIPTTTTTTTTAPAPSSFYRDSHSVSTPPAAPLLLVSSSSSSSSQHNNNKPSSQPHPPPESSKAVDELLQRQNDELRIEIACVRSEKQRLEAASEAANGQSQRIAQLEQLVAELQQSAAKQQQQQRGRDGDDKRGLRRGRRRRQSFQLDVEEDVAVLVQFQAAAAAAAAGNQTCSRAESFYHAYTSAMCTSSCSVKSALRPSLLAVLHVEARTTTRVLLAVVRILVCLQRHYPCEGEEEEHQLVAALCCVLREREVVDEEEEGEGVNGGDELEAAIVRYLACTLSRQSSSSTAVRSLLEHVPHLAFSRELLPVFPFPADFPHSPATWDAVPSPFRVIGGGGLEAVHCCQLLLYRFGFQSAMGFLLHHNVLEELVRALYQSACVRNSPTECDTIRVLFARVWGAMSSRSAELRGVRRLIAALLWIQDVAPCSSRPRLTAWARSMLAVLPKD